MSIRTLSAALALALLPAPALAVDTNQPLLCALTEVVECAGEGECARIDPGELNLPPFVRVDVKGRKIAEHRGERSSPVATVNQRDGHVYLQGFEERAFGISIARETGRLVATATGEDAGFVLFGVCTEL